MPKATFAARYENLARICEFVSTNAKSAGLDDSAAYAVELATNEAATNIIEHAYGGEGDGKIECAIEADDHVVTVVLRDWGEPFDASKVPQPDFSVPLEELSIRGAGLRLIRGSMDEVEFEPVPGGGNRLTMRKTVRKGDRAPAPSE